MATITRSFLDTDVVEEACRGVLPIRLRGDHLVGSMQDEDSEAFLNHSSRMQPKQTPALLDTLTKLVWLDGREELEALVHAHSGEHGYERLDLTSINNPKWKPCGAVV